MTDLITRRGLGVLGAGMAGAGLFNGTTLAQGLALPKQPVALNIIDVAGNLALTQPALEAYRAAKPNLVSRMTYTKAPAPELPAKLKAQQAANRVDIDLVLTGTDALSAGIDQNLWVELLPAHAGGLPKLQDIYLEPAARMQGLARGQGVVVTYYPSGPLLSYMPARVRNVPKTAEELLEWSKQNKNKLIYARPANSGPGRTFMMGLPYILKDANPKDPVKGWDKTWAYLKALGENIEYYPSGTTPTMKEFGDGTRDMVVTTTGWDINPRVLGIVPKEAAVFSLAGFSWVADAHYMCVPKGLGEEKLAVILDLMSFMLQPAQQAYAYDEGYFYPGPAVKGVTLAMAPKASQDALKEFGRPEYDAMIAGSPVELPLDPDVMVQAFRLWDEQVGGSKRR
ncbi:ABC transporter substrate-binding protein [Candidatus Raskinella chloraquaticus]|jgi:putative spermidine/putrescine transport system substrate-binding protein|uniref:ABC transporter substrate-binding protein n=1 Tax=Candidatus Raskinella chloraquaticus TaxID=1951219 RepID=A0A1W9I0K8_9HYPH|nr:MAG: ABC transporter substrate-binding protein [Proteobacteria bacterium SG_bin8]